MRSPANSFLEIAQPLEALGLGDLLGIGTIDAIDLCRLQKRVAAHFGGAQGGRRVGSEERVAGAGGEDDDAAFLHMANRPAADVGLAHRLHGDRRQHAGDDAAALERTLHGQ